jgi:hypothetical protein
MSGEIKAAGSRVGELLDRLIAPCVRWSSHRWWPVIAVAVALGLVWATGFPNYIPKGPPEFLRALEWWLQHPFQAIPVADIFGTVEPDDGYASHCDKRVYRGLLPLLHTVLPFGLPMVRVVGYLAGVAVFAICYLLVSRGRKDPLAAALFIWALALSYSGPWPFIDWHYFGDGLAVALLVAAMLARPVWLSALLIVLAGFTDERAIVASPLVGLFKAWQELPPFAQTSPSVFAAPLRYLSAGQTALWGIIGYAAIRLILSTTGTGPSGSSQLASLPILLEHYYESFPARVFSVFEFLWSVPVLFVWSGLAYLGRTNTKWLLFGLFMCMAAVPAVLVRDIDRSLYYLLPGLVGALVFLPQGSASVRRMLAVCLIGGLIYTPLNQFVFNKAVINAVGGAGTKINR